MKPAALWSGSLTKSMRDLLNQQYQCIYEFTETEAARTRPVQIYTRWDTIAERKSRQLPPSLCQKLLPIYNHLQKKIQFSPRESYWKNILLLGMSCMAISRLSDIFGGSWYHNFLSELFLLLFFYLFMYATYIFLSFYSIDPLCISYGFQFQFGLLLKGFLSV